MLGIRIRVVASFEMEERVIEIRINSLDSLGDCILCNSSSTDSDSGASGKTKLPELFTIDGEALHWVCVFCTRNQLPALAELILIARSAERYNSLFFKDELKQIRESFQVKPPFAIRIDAFAQDRPCGLCGRLTVSSSYPSYKTGFPEMFIGESIVCWDCGEEHAPELNSFRDLAQAAERYAEYLPIEHWPKCNDKPEMSALIGANGWISCPNCQKRFSSKDKHRWHDNIHVTCGQKIIFFEGSPPESEYTCNRRGDNEAVL